MADADITPWDESRGPSPALSPTLLEERELPEDHGSQEEAPDAPPTAESGVFDGEGAAEAPSAAHSSEQEPSSAGEDTAAAAAAPEAKERADSNADSVSGSRALSNALVGATIGVVQREEQEARDKQAADQAAAAEAERQEAAARESEERMRKEKLTLTAFPGSSKAPTGSQSARRASAASHSSSESRGGPATGRRTTRHAPAAVLPRAKLAIDPLRLSAENAIRQMDPRRARHLHEEIRRKLEHLRPRLAESLVGLAYVHEIETYLFDMDKELSRNATLASIEPQLDLCRQAMRKTRILLEARESTPGQLQPAYKQVVVERNKLRKAFPDDELTEQFVEECDELVAAFVSRAARLLGFASRRLEAALDSVTNRVQCDALFQQIKDILHGERWILRETNDGQRLFTRWTLYLTSVRSRVDKASLTESTRKRIGELRLGLKRVQSRVTSHAAKIGSNAFAGALRSDWAAATDCMRTIVTAPSKTAAAHAADEPAAVLLSPRATESAEDGDGAGEDAAPKLTPRTKRNRQIASEEDAAAERARRRAAAEEQRRAEEMHAHLLSLSEFQSCKRQYKTLRSRVQSLLPDLDEDDVLHFSSADEDGGSTPARASRTKRKKGRVSTQQLSMARLANRGAPTRPQDIRPASVTLPPLNFGGLVGPEIYMDEKGTMHSSSPKAATTRRRRKGSRTTRGYETVTFDENDKTDGIVTEGTRPTARRPPKSSAARAAPRKKRVVAARATEPQQQTPRPPPPARRGANVRRAEPAPPVDLGTTKTRPSPFGAPQVLLDNYDPDVSLRTKRIQQQAAGGGAQPLPPVAAQGAAEDAAAVGDDAAQSDSDAAQSDSDTAAGDDALSLHGLDADAPAKAVNSPVSSLELRSTLTRLRGKVDSPAAAPPEPAPADPQQTARDAIVQDVPPPVSDNPTFSFI